MPACGGDDPATSDSPAAATVVHNAPARSEQDVVDALNLGVDDDSDGRPDRPGSADDTGLVTPDGCAVLAVLTGESQVKLYIDAGDTVITSPEGDVGVKISASEAEACSAGIAAKLAEGG